MKFIILGCGYSMGVPRSDGFFGKCNPKNKKNYRTRCSALIKLSKENILIDTSPDLRHQLLANKIKTIDKVFYTHKHADQTHGINDLRCFFLKNKKPINVYADSLTANYLKKSFDYCFNKNSNGYPITLKMNKITKDFIIHDKNRRIKIKPIKVKHGDIESICYIINKELAYISDVNEIYSKDFKYFKNLKYLIIDCLWYKHNPAHFNLKKSLSMIKMFSPKKAILTNLHTDLDYDQLKRKLPKNIFPAYDGFAVKL